MNWKIDILAIGVHPDDVELSAAGTLLRHRDMGHRFALLDLTRGELGTRGTKETRTAEACVSAELLGAVARPQLDLGDGFFTSDKAAMLPIIGWIRRFRPAIVLCNALSDRHPDHGRSAKLAADACFYAGLPKILLPEGMDGAEAAAWRPKAVYHYIQDNYSEPDFVVDITPYFAQKKEAILAFRSQFYDPNAAEDGPRTPISGKEFLDYIEAKARVFGRSIGVEYAEGFHCARVPGVSNLFNLE